MVVTCDIQFENNPLGTYYAGQVIMGKITLATDKIKKVKAVSLKINGFAHTSWSEETSSNSQKSSSTTRYQGHVDYINSCTILLAPNATDEAVLIEPGIHSFSFACHIPVSCPSSFEGSYGHIRYVIQIELTRPWKFDQTFTRAFTVLKVMDLNYDSPLLKLQIKGFAHTQWTESGSDNSSDTTCSGHIDYIKAQSHLLQPSERESDVIIEPGILCFSFNCHIPIHCPTSVEVYNGHIRYLVQVDLIRPWKMPSNTEIQKVFCCGPFKTDPLQIHIQLPQTGYVPGQLIPVSVLVTNDTKVPIDEICLRLVMMVCLYSTTPYQRSKNETMTIAKLKGDAVMQHCKKHFSYLLPIPATPPTCFNLCAIIQIAYRVEVEAKMNGIMYTNQCIHTPVTIGNVPLQMDGVVIQQQPLAREFNANRCNETQNTMEVMAIHGRSSPESNNDSCVNNSNREPWSAVANISAPVYMEASHMPQGKLSDDSAHDYGEKNFTPKYPVFSIPSPASTSPKCDEADGQILPFHEADPNKTTWL